MFQGKPIIGILGGIGSGKSTVARMFGEMRCLVIGSDEQVREAYEDPQIQRTIRQWWGDEAFDKAGRVRRDWIGRKVFADQAERGRLEELLHPWVAKARDKVMRAAVDDAQVLAFIWDTPLLVEAGWDKECDVLVFVKAPWEERLERVRQNRGWDEAELRKRENLQTPLDKKEKISDYIISNTADLEFTRDQARKVLSRILSALQQAGPANQNRPVRDD
ncbi:MAG: dephospho-CoA kinase [Phycisphaerales bacterium]|nr:dephospho-CoA kinase [Phycisphaerales bacterium]